MLARRAADYTPNAKTAPPAVPENARPYVERVLSLFADLTDAEAAIAVRMMRGETLKEIAKRRGVSLQSVYAAWRNMVGRSPAWLAIANGAIGNGRGRRNKGGANYLNPAQAPGKRRTENRR